MRSFSVLIVVFELSTAVLADSLPEFRFLDATARQRIDASAAELDRNNEEPEQLNRPFYGGLAGWALATAPLPDAEELARAADQHRRICAEMSIVPTPPAAAAILEKLAEEVPSAYRTRQFRLVVVDAPGPLAWTAGGEFVYVTRSYLDALAHDAKGAEARLALVLGHELGHICLDHCRRAYLLLDLTDTFGGELEAEVDHTLLRRATAAAVQTVGGVMQFLFSKEQERRADLFALHLVRNAGFDEEAALDALRPWVAAQKAAPPRHLGGPIHSTPAERLHRLRHELDGTYDNDDFGLFRYDKPSKCWQPLRRGDLKKRDRPIVLVHGMESRLATWEKVLDELLDHPEFAERPILGYHYPGDGSLTRAGRGLVRVMKQVPAPQRANFVCHSAGGLVFRYYAEVHEGAFDRAVMLGTPQQGSNLAELRPVMELGQFFRDLELGYSESLRRTLADGHDQISIDLAHGSLFLNYLNRQQADRARYGIVRGRLVGGLGGFAMQQITLRLRDELAQRLHAIQKEHHAARRTHAFVKRMVLPPEVLIGDLVVSLASAELQGVSEIVTVRASHDDLIQESESINTALDLLANP